MMRFSAVIPYFFLLSVGCLQAYSSLASKGQYNRLAPRSPPLYPHQKQRQFSVFDVSDNDWDFGFDNFFSQGDDDPRHDEIIFRMKAGGKYISAIPQAQRYSTKDWFHNLRTIPSSQLLKRIKGIVSLNFVWSTVVYLFHKYVCKIPDASKCLTILGSTLSLLLVFRTNAAYNRFWEGRKVWESVVTTLRNLGRLTMMYSQHMTSAQVERIFNLCCAFPMILQEHLSAKRSNTELLALFMSPAEIEDICKVTNRPYYLICKLSEEFYRIRDATGTPAVDSFSSRERQAFLKYLDDLTRAVGQAERLIQTPIPLPYARHTSRFLSLFCLSTPLALTAELSINTIPFATFLTWSLFGVLEIGMSIEEPFRRALNLETFTYTVLKDFSDLMHVTKISPTGAKVDSQVFEYRYLDIAPRGSQETKKWRNELQESQHSLENPFIDLSKFKNTTTSTTTNTNTNTNTNNHTNTNTNTNTNTTEGVRKDALIE